ncbi:hypothetical protein V6N11_055081 [Hibiscus sabdariffa]|uniref:Uncharacterized protein n=1 Tax=Hibiscus sabdariffa TaxID=183260 RepID=A0ABR1ZQX0_9ROSI
MLRSSPPANLNLKSAGYSNIAASRSKAGSLALFSSLASILYNGGAGVLFLASDIIPRASLQKETLTSGSLLNPLVVLFQPLGGALTSSFVLFQASSLTYSFCYLFLGHFKLATAIELQFKQLNRR